jgi:hypothetical protein
MTIFSCIIIKIATASNTNKITISCMTSNILRDKVVVDKQ